MGLLRLWLALCVVSTHSGLLWGFRFMEGGDAVATFFILAGFFAALMIDRRYRGRYRVFYLNRLVRVWPLYLLALGTALLVISLGVNVGRVLLGPASVLPYVTHYPAPAWTSGWALSQFFLLGQDAFNWAHLLPTGEVRFGLAFHGSILMSNFALLPQAWSLTLEEYFYLCAPALERLGLRASGALFTLWALAYRPLWHLDDRLPLQSFPAAVGLFIGGIFAYRCYQRWLAHPAELARWRTWGLLAYALFVVSAGYHHASQPLIASAAILGIPLVFDAFQGRAWDRWLGDLSYPIYLFHQCIVWAVVWIWPEPAAGSNHCPLIMGIAVAVAVVLALLLETPLRRYRSTIS